MKTSAVALAAALLLAAVAAFPQQENCVKGPGLMAGCPRIPVGPSPMGQRPFPPALPPLPVRGDPLFCNGMMDPRNGDFCLERWAEARLWPRPVPRAKRQIGGGGSSSAAAAAASSMGLGYGMMGYGMMPYGFMG